MFNFKLSDREKKVIALVALTALGYNFYSGGQIVFVNGNVGELNLAKAKIDSLETQLDSTQVELAAVEFDRNIDELVMTSPVKFDVPDFEFSTEAFYGVEYNDTDGTSVAK